MQKSVNISNGFQNLTEDFCARKFDHLEAAYIINIKFRQIFVAVTL